MVSQLLGGLARLPRRRRRFGLRARALTTRMKVLSRHHFTTKAHARQVVVAWCHDFYNSRRRHSSAALKSPIQYERLAADQPAAA